MMNKYNKKELEKLIIEQNKSYSSIGKMYGVSDTAIKKAAKKFGIELPKKRSINPKENFKHSRSGTTSLIDKVNDDDFKTIISSSNSWKSIADKLGYKSNLSVKHKKSIIIRCEKLGMSLVFDRYTTLSNKTKGELFAERKNWQSARTAIRKHANRIFFENNTTHKCAICGYDKHIEVAHIKAVSDFDDTATIREINSITNLIGLCPNHHWEYDNGVIEL